MRKVLTFLAASLCSAVLHFPAPAQTPAFAVATIKPGKHTTQNAQRPYRGGYEARDATVRDLIAFAYNVPFGADSLISGGPKWAYNTTFDIEAKSQADAEGLPSNQQKIADADLDRLMLQSLLAARFKLKLHRQTTLVPAFALMIANGGPKFSASKPPPPPDDTQTYAFGATLPTPRQTGMRMLPGDMHAPHATMGWLAGYLQFQPELEGCTVSDKTNLPGEFDVSLKWSPEGARTADTPTSDPGLFLALQEQLGLKLEPSRGPVKSLVIDHIEKPSEN